MLPASDRGTHPGQAQTVGVMPAPLHLRVAGSLFFSSKGISLYPALDPGLFGSASFSRFGGP
jgi:hypothetical protein